MLLVRLKPRRRRLDPAERHWRDPALALLLSVYIDDLASAAPLRELLYGVLS